jgi:hypothetical protein
LRSRPAPGVGESVRRLVAQLLVIGGGLEHARVRIAGPELSEGEFEQREIAGAPPDVCDQPLRQPRLEAAAATSRRLLDSLDQLVVGHRQQSELPVLEENIEAGLRQREAEEVPPERDQDLDLIAARGQQRVDEVRAHGGRREPR